MCVWCTSGVAALLKLPFPEVGVRKPKSRPSATRWLWTGRPFYPPLLRSAWSLQPLLLVSRTTGPCGASWVVHAGSAGTEVLVRVRVHNSGLNRTSERLLGMCALPQTADFQKFIHPRPDSAQLVRPLSAPTVVLRLSVLFLVDFLIAWKTALSKTLFFFSSLEFYTVYSMVVVISINSSCMLKDWRWRSSRDGVCHRWLKSIPSSPSLSMSSK